MFTLVMEALSLFPCCLVDINGMVNAIWKFQHWHVRPWAREESDQGREKSKMKSNTVLMRDRAEERSNNSLPLFQWQSVSVDVSLQNRTVTQLRLKPIAAAAVQWPEGRSADQHGNHGSRGPVPPTPSDFRRSLQSHPGRRRRN